MDINKAKEHLKDVIEDDGLHSLGWYLAYTNGNSKATLDGEFTAEDLEAIACYMKHSKGE